MNDKYKCLQAETYIKLGVGTLLVVVLGALHWFNPDLYLQIGYLLTSGDIQAIVDILRSYGIWAMIVSILIDVFINVLGFLPTIFISAANGVVFGLLPGVIISWLAECIGVIISFWLMRRFLRQTAERLIANSKYLQKIDTFSGANGFKMMLAARSLPYFPSGIITALGALSSIRFRDYVLATMIGKFPAVTLEVVIGHDLITYEQNLVRLSLVILVIIGIYLGSWWWRRRKAVKNRMNE
ncbi:TVP38/TMEM64 family protein [Anaerosinus massiliensis]|uniref:TVP38/TMEM64 family protein n=1 Tax=Massilibacillus massiliensis TaxID=1806837 RepID=UPI000DA62AD7|nr:TVP38/TMEM64 family protein [Massilibacillus massiliensis]